MNNLTLLILVISFMIIVLLAYGAFLTFSKHRNLKKRMAETETPAIQATVLRQDEETSPLKKKLLSWLSSSGQWGLKNEKELSKTQTLLMQAGLRHPNAPAIFYGLRVLVALFLPLPFILLALVRDRLGPPVMLASFMVCGLGYSLPQFGLQYLVRRRQERLERALPDVMDLFIICMEAGLALQATINRVAEEIRSVCRDFFFELQTVAGEMRTGISRDMALSNLSHRTGVQSVQSLVTLMVQSEKLGTSIADALRVHGDFLRIQRTQKAEEAAGKLPVKILFPLIFFIFPAMFVVIVGPGAIQIVRNLLPAMGGK